MDLRLGFDHSASTSVVDCENTVPFDAACVVSDGPVYQELDDRYDSDFYLQNFYEYEEGREEGRRKTWCVVCSCHRQAVFP